MYKKLLTRLFFITFICILFLVTSSNVSFNKLFALQSGMLVSELVINNGKVIPSLIESDSIGIDLKIQTKNIFWVHDIYGSFNINGIKYLLSSSDYVNGEYVVGLSFADKNEIAGTLKITKDLRHYSINLNNNSYYIIGPAKTPEEAMELTNKLFGYN